MDQSRMPKVHMRDQFLPSDFPSLSRTANFSVNIKHVVSETTIGKILCLLRHSPSPSLFVRDNISIASKIEHRQAARTAAG